MWFNLRKENNTTDIQAISTDLDKNKISNSQNNQQRTTAYITNHETRLSELGTTNAITCDSGQPSLSTSSGEFLSDTNQPISPLGSKVTRKQWERPTNSVEASLLALPSKLPLPVTGQVINKSSKIPQSTKILTTNETSSTSTMSRSNNDNDGDCGNDRRRRVHFNPQPNQLHYTIREEFEEDYQEYDDSVYFNPHENSMPYYAYSDIGGRPEYIQLDTLLEDDETQSALKGYIERRSGETVYKHPVKLRNSTEASILMLGHQEYKAQPVMAHCEKGSVPSIPVRQTQASYARINKIREENQLKLDKMEQENEQYMPPLQRKEATLKELTRQYQEAQDMIEQRRMELEIFQFNRDQDIASVVSHAGERVDQLAGQLEMTTVRHFELEKKREETQKQLEELQQQLETLKKEKVAQELKHQEMMLKMYVGGRNSVSFTSEDDVEHEINKDPSPNAIPQLIESIDKAQRELEFWQNMKFDLDPESAQTEANSTLRFLRDAMFHYLTETKKEDTELHLHAIVGIFDFNETQMKTIKKSLEERKKKGRI